MIAEIISKDPLTFLVLSMAFLMTILVKLQIMDMRPSNMFEGYVKRTLDMLWFFGVLVIGLLAALVID